MIRYNIYLGKKQLDELEALSKNSISVSEQIRQAIDKYLEEQHEKSTSTSPSRDHISEDYAPSKEGDSHG